MCTVYTYIYVYGGLWAHGIIISQLYTLNIMYGIYHSCLNNKLSFLPCLCPTMHSLPV